MEEHRVGEEDRKCWELGYYLNRASGEGFTREELTAVEEVGERARGVACRDWAHRPRRAREDVAGGRVLQGDSGPEAEPRRGTEPPSRVP